VDAAGPPSGSPGQSQGPGTASPNRAYLGTLEGNEEAGPCSPSVNLLELSDGLVDNRRAGQLSRRPCRPGTVLPTAAAMATSRSVRVTPYAHPRAARYQAGSLRPLPGRAPTSADRDAQARGVAAVHGLWRHIAGALDCSTDLHRHQPPNRGPLRKPSVSNLCRRRSAQQHETRRDRGFRIGGQLHPRA